MSDYLGAGSSEYIFGGYELSFSPSMVTLSTTTGVAGTWVTFDSISTTNATTIKWLVQVKTSTEIHSTEIVVTVNGSNIYMDRYGDIYSTLLSDFDATLNGSQIELLAKPTNNYTTYKAIRYAIQP